MNRGTKKGSYTPPRVASEGNAEVPTRGWTKAYSTDKEYRERFGDTYEEYKVKLKRKWGM